VSLFVVPEKGAPQPGGPVLNLRGEVVGISVGTLTAGQNLNFAVPFADVRALAYSPSSRIAFPPLRETRTGEANRTVVTGPAAREPSKGNLLLSLPDDPVQLRAMVFQLPVRGTEVRQNILIRFLGCYPIQAHSEMACFLRIGNIATGGRTRLFLDQPSLNDSYGMGARLNEVVYMATGERGGASLSRVTCRPARKN